MGVELAAMAGGQPAAFAEELRQEKVKKDKAKLNALDAQKRKAQDKRDAEVIKNAVAARDALEKKIADRKAKMAQGHRKQY